MASTAPKLVPPAADVLVVTAGVAAVAAVSLAAPWVSARELQLATTQWPANPALAFDRLAIARRLNPLSDEPDVIAGVIAGKVGDLTRERQSFERALQRDRLDWYALFELGVVDGVEGKRASAIRRLDAAGRLNPREPLIQDVRNQVSHGERPDPQEIDREFAARASILLKHPGQHPPR